jgi:c(7)-type cytochrome triheme protein
MRSLRLCICVGTVLLLCAGASALATWLGGPRGAGGLAAAEQRGGATGFDHAAHAQRVELAGAAAVPCTRCHAMDRRGRVARRLGHVACFGECHGPRPSRAAEGPARRAVCTVCHAAESLERPGPGRTLAVPAGPLSAREHVLAMSHAAHDAPSQAHGGCRACHAPGQEDGPPGTRASDDAHARCMRCHLAGAGPGATETGPVSMNQCSRCHVAAEAGARRPALVSGPYRASFSHARHRARGHDDCRGCHVAVLAASGNDLPAPSTQECAGCHDGVQAFSVLGPQCRRCHAERGQRPGFRERRGPAYSHVEHQQEHGVDMPCTRCHQLDARGIPLPPAADHAPCSDAGCHREEFMAREPAICGACHLGTEPWLRLYFQPQQRLDTEFGARFSHRRHQQLGTALMEACERCHRRPSQQRDLGLPGQHEACMGTGCHEPTAVDVDHAVGPTPLSACTGCHERDLVARRRVQRLGAPWSVRARFDHAPHRTEPSSGAAVPCAACHQGVAEADRVADIPGPPKRACAPCHDGRAAFKLTGHGCARCHGGARQP